MLSVKIFLFNQLCKNIKIERFYNSGEIMQQKLLVNFMFFQWSDAFGFMLQGFYFAFIEAFPVLQAASNS